MATATLALVLMVPLGCSSEGDTLPYQGGSGEQMGGVLTGPCKDGGEHACSETLDQENGVLSCWEGTQHCVDGHWGPCVDGELTLRPDWRKEGFEHLLDPQSRSAATKCGALNPCDPSCMRFVEDPTPDLTATPGSPPMSTVPNWGITANGTATCAHDLCTVGNALGASCHTCASKVCAADPSCCVDSGPGNEWDDDCVDLVYSTCTANVVLPTATVCDYGVFVKNNLTTSGSGTVFLGGPIGSARPSTSYTDYSVNVSGATIASVQSAGTVFLDNVTVQKTVQTNYVGNVCPPSATNCAIQHQNTVTVGGTPLPNEITNAGITFPTIPTKTISCPAVSGSQTVGGSVSPTAPDIVTANPGDLKAYTLSSDASTLIFSAPGNYGSIQNNASNATIIFAQAGTYTFSSINMGGSSPRILVPQTGTVQIDVCNDLEFANAARTLTWGDATAVNGCGAYSGTATYAELDVVSVGSTAYRCRHGQGALCSNSGGTVYQPGVGASWTTAWSTSLYTGSYCATTTPPNPFSVRFYTNDTNVKIGPGALASGVLVAPNAEVHAYSANGLGSLKGLIYSQSFVGEAGVKLDSTGLTGQACVDAGIDPGFNQCPVNIVLPQTQDAINEPCQSGLDCQVNTRCVDVESGDSCAHHKCDEGTKLDPSCDTCVAKICAAKPSCCTTTWDADCVSRVKTDCDAWCGANTILPCAHDMCATGPKLDAACDPCAGNVCLVDPTCCTGSGTAWSASCVDKVRAMCQPEGGDICDYAVFASNASTIRAEVAGGYLGGGPVSIQAGASTWDVTSQGAVTVTGGSTGPVSAKGAVTVSGGSTGPVLQNLTTLATSGVPTQTFTCGAAATNYTTGTNSPAAGSFGAVTVSGSGTILSLSAGTYDFNSLNLGNNTILRVPATGTVSIRICGTLTIGTGVQVQLATGTIAAADALRIQWYVAGSGSSTIGSSSVIYGVIRAPAGTVTLGSGARLTGMLHAYGVDMATTSRVDATALTGIACHMQNLGYTALPAAADAGACDFGVIGSASVSLDAATIKGDIASGTTGFAGNGGWHNTTITGNVYSQGPLTLVNTDVTGDAKSVGTYSRTGGSVTGTGVGGQTTVPGGSIPTTTFACPTGGANQTFSSSGTFTLPASTPANTYGAVTLGDWSGAVLSLTAGTTYYMSSLTVGNGAKLAMPATGNVTINVCGKVYFGDQSQITGLTAGADSLRLRIYTAYNTVDTSSCANAGICISNQANLKGVFRAPSSGIRLNQDAVVAGLLQGARVRMENSSTGVVQLDSTGATGSNCITAGLGSAAGSTSSACPVVTATAPRRHEEGTCTANALAFTDTTGCATKFDLAVNFPCDNQVQVCNHGGVAAPAGAVVTLYPRSGQQFAPNSPDPAWALDTCTVTSTIAAGQCATATCNAAWFTGASSQDLTMMVNVGGTTPANECSLLDNWSLFDKTRTCTVATPTDEVQVYEARCPNVDVNGVSRGTSPRWGSLSWDSDTPGTSEVRWEGRVASTSTGFAGAYKALGLANDASGNEVCEKDTMITGCPVKLTTQLAVGQSLPTTCDSTGCSSFLQVRARLNPGGTSAPTLRDWEVTYSCVFDE